MPECSRTRIRQMTQHCEANRRGFGYHYQHVRLTCVLAEGDLAMLTHDAAPTRARGGRRRADGDFEGVSGFPGARKGCSLRPNRRAAAEAFRRAKRSTV